jgi:hypothetical protein
MAEKWNAKEIKKLIQLHAVEALSKGMAVAQTSLLMRLDRGQNVQGGRETYKSDYFKDAARRSALGGTRGSARRSGGKRANALSKGTNYKGKPVDWLLTGAMRRGITILKPVRKGTQTEITLTLQGTNSGGESNAQILKYNIKRRPLMWGFSKKEFQAAIDEIRKYFKKAAY